MIPGFLQSLQFGANRLKVGKELFIPGNKVPNLAVPADGASGAAMGTGVLGLEVPGGDLENGPESTGFTFVPEKHRHPFVYALNLHTILPIFHRIND
jgi:hypothetical protein